MTIGISTLLGETIKSIEINEEKTQIIFTIENKYSKKEIKYIMYHNQDCCEQVWIEDICGDLQDLIGSVVLEAQETRSKLEYPEYRQSDEYDDSFQWTFYKLGTKKGFVTIRWFGTSNGWYSEDVDFEPYE